MEIKIKKEKVIVNNTNYKIKMLLQLIIILLFVILTTVYTVNAEENVVEINATNFPDATFRKYISTHIDKNKDNKLSQKEREGISLVMISGKSLNIKGIEYFINLDYCSIRANEEIYNLDAVNSLKKLTELNVWTDNKEINVCIENPYLQNLILTGKGIKKIDISNSTNIINLEITNTSKKSIELDVSQIKNLKNLEVMGKLKEIKWGEKKKSIESINLNNYTKNKKSIKFSKFPKLKSIDIWCDKNQRKVVISDCPKLVSIGITGNSKKQSFYLKNLPSKLGLEIDNSKIQKLSLKKVPRLVGFYAEGSILKNVPIEKYKKLESISVSDEYSIKTLNIKPFKKLEYFCWTMCKLEKITVGKNKRLTDFNINLNKIKGTVDLSGCPKLELVSMEENKISKVKLPEKKKRLTFFKCNNNKIKEVNLYNSKVDEVYTYDNPGITVYLPYKMKGDAFLLGKTKKVYYQKNKYVKN